VNDLTNFLFELHPGTFRLSDFIKDPNMPGLAAEIFRHDLETDAFKAAGEAEEVSDEAIVAYSEIVAELLNGIYDHFSLHSFKRFDECVLISFQYEEDVGILDDSTVERMWQGEDIVNFSNPHLSLLIKKSPLSFLPSKAVLDADYAFHTLVHDHGL